MSGFCIDHLVELVLMVAEDGQAASKHPKGCWSCLIIGKRLTYQARLQLLHSDRIKISFLSNTWWNSYIHSNDIPSTGHAACWDEPPPNNTSQSSSLYKMTPVYLDVCFSVAQATLHVYWKGIDYIVLCKRLEELCLWPPILSLCSSQ